MINARELQIGNHIVSNGINYTVLGIIQNVGMPTVINVCDEHNRILDLNEEECEPKSITPSILTEFGFVPLNSYPDILKLKITDLMSLYAIKIEEEENIHIVISAHVQYGADIVFQAAKENTCINSLHKLENLYNLLR